MCNYIKLGEIIMNVSLKEPMTPLWIMFPWISRYSIGWRMGYWGRLSLQILGMV